MWMNVFELPVGTEFFVNNGHWDGKIVDIDGENHVHVFATGSNFKQSERGGYELDIKVTKSVTENGGKSVPNALTMSNLERAFEAAYQQEANYIAVKVSMEGFSEDEIIINSSENFDSKLVYYRKTYDANLQHKHAAGISIVGFTYGDTFADIEDDLIEP